MSTSRIDPHVKVLDEGLVQRAARRGLDAVVYAPHFTQLPEIRRRAEALSTEDLLVVPGREVFTGTYRNRKHVLALGLEEPVPDFVSLEAAMAEFERQDATVLVPHPEYLTVGLTEADLRQYADVIDAIEVYNPKYLPGHGRRSRSLAAALDVPAFGSSYAHLGWTIGDVWTEVDEELTVALDGGRVDGNDGGNVDGAGKIDGSGRGDGGAPNGGPSERDLGNGGPSDGSLDEVDVVASALTTGGNRVSRRSGVGPRLRSAAEVGHLAWENTVKKIDRIGFPGMEATHPNDDLYEGRFDDAYVY